MGFANLRNSLPCGSIASRWSSESGCSPEMTRDSRVTEAPMLPLRYDASETSEFRARARRFRAATNSLACAWFEGTPGRDRVGVPR